MSTSLPDRLRRAMIIRVNHRKHSYVLIDARFLENSALSMRAKGLLAICLSLPDKARISLHELIDKSREGRDAVKAAMKELAQNGYAQLHSGRNASGHVTGKEWHIYESPDLRTESLKSRLSAHRLKSRSSVNRQPEKPSVGKSVYR